MLGLLGGPSASLHGPTAPQPRACCGAALQLVARLGLPQSLRSPLMPLRTLLPLPPVAMPAGKCCDRWEEQCNLGAVQVPDPAEQQLTVDTRVAGYK